MLINYWDCEYSEADEIECGTEDEPDYYWRYGCNHPENRELHCGLDNQWGGDTDDCKLLDVRRA